MKFKNILNKPYKYNYFYKYNKYYKIVNTFNNTSYTSNELLTIFNITNKNLLKFSHIINKYFLFLKFKIASKLIQLGIIKTLKQSKYIITYGKILINGYLNKNPNLQLKLGDYIQFIPILYLEHLYFNLSLFKHYLFKRNSFFNILQKNIININKGIVYINI